MYLADVGKVLLPSVLPFEIKSEWSSNIQKAEQSKTVDLMVELLDFLTDGRTDVQSHGRRSGTLAKTII